MTISRQAIALIGRVHPEIFELLGGPPVLVRGQEVELNPQPLPPAEDGFRQGVLAGAELVRLAVTSQRLGVSFDVDPDDWCPTPPRRPKLPPVPWPPVDWNVDPRAEVEQAWVTEYTAGLLVGLDAADAAWRETSAAKGVDQVRQVAIDNASQLGG